LKLIDNVLDAYANIDPAKILIKIKLHMLSHLPEDIRRRGPAVRFATEIFECFNAVFRMCSVLSSHQAPSRDIATKFADLDRVKHILSGGHWQEDSARHSAGKKVTELLFKSPIIQQHLGWAPDVKWQAGEVKYPPKSKKNGRPSFSTSQTALLDASFDNDNVRVAVEKNTLMAMCTLCYFRHW
jgi:hypothetical protein